MSEVWVNVYEDGTVGSFMDSEQTARECIRHDMSVLKRVRLHQAEKNNVQGCNSHEDLLEALLVALPYVTDAFDNAESQFKPGVVLSHVKQIRSAIAKAELRQ